ncbi:protein of unknown function (plasmid) [Caballeronia sp. S22]
MHVATATGKHRSDLFLHRQRHIWTSEAAPRIARIYTGRGRRGELVDRCVLPPDPYPGRSVALPHH